MGLATAGLQSGGGGPASSLGPGATGSTLVLSGTSTALQYIATQASGSDAYKMSDGARINFSTADASAYFYRSFANVIRTPGTIRIDGSIQLSTAGIIDLDSGGSDVSIYSNAGSGQVNVNGSIAGGAGYDALLNCGVVGTRWANVNAVNVNSEHYTIVTKGDSTASPGAAVLNTGCGKSAIAAGASSVVITNSLVATTSLVLVTMLGVDATGLLPRISNIGAGSFTLTTTGNCTGNLLFQWFVVT